MSIASRLVEWIDKLPAADTRDVVFEPDLVVPMPDGVKLLANRYYPRGGDKAPIILIRSPYGRTRLFGLLFGRIFAERGFQVLIQSCRGTFGSGGKFDPLRNEKADGLATLAWLKKQPWFSGKFATFGPSYLGLVQWAVADQAGPELKAMSVQVTASEFRNPTYVGESFGLETSLTWVYLVDHQEGSFLAAMLALPLAARALRPVYGHLPLRTADVAAVGKPVQFLRDWLDHNQPGDAWWDASDFSKGVSQVTVPVLMIGGWYDLFLPQMLVDYAKLRQAGQRPHLTIGPWVHTSAASMPVMLRESIGWFKAHLLGDSGGLRELPVRICVMGINEWRGYADWPPADYTPRRWHLQPGGRLSTDAPGASEPDRYRYDPADPTPSVGGSGLSQNSGPKDNRKLEQRSDVLTYTTEPLAVDTEVIGPVTAELYVKSSVEHTDFFVRLCDVDPSGKSINISDGLVRLDPKRPVPTVDGCLKVTVNLWATACCFRRGHRIRVQVSSGAHPQFARNTGSGEPLATAIVLRSADQAIYHDPSHPSAILLPMKG